MSQANVEQFFQQVGQDTSLQQQLQSLTSKDAMSSKSVELGKQKGLNFTSSEVESWLKSKVAEKTGRAPSDKLTDEELEAVGGGTTPVCVITLTVTVTK